MFYGNRVDFLQSVGILAAVGAYSGVTNPTRCQCQPSNCQQSDASGNGAETLQHPSKRSPTRAGLKGAENAVRAA